VPRVSQHGSDGENTGVVTQEEPQRAQVTLDPEIADTIRQIAQEQRGLRTEVNAYPNTKKIGAGIPTH
jgi:hypothetical protein